MIVGLTGGIATGKSFIAQVWRREGACIIEADKVGHELLRKGEIKEKIKRAFGEEVFGPDGEVDRGKLAEIVFSCPEKLRLLNSIMHPPMVKLIKERLRSMDCGVKVVEAAVLFEMGLDRICDVIVLVICSREEQVKRLVEKGFSPQQAEKRVEAQRDYRELEGRADFVILTDGSLQETEKKALEIYREIIRREKDGFREKQG